MSVKKSMLAIWAVASVLWIVFSCYMFDLKGAMDANRTFMLYQSRWEKSHGTSSLSVYRAAGKRVDRMNQNICLFMLIGIGFPALMLSVGTYALRDVDKKKNSSAR
jgi:hypothetical protein